MIARSRAIKINHTTNNPNAASRPILLPLSQHFTAYDVIFSAVSILIRFFISSLPWASIPCTSRVPSGGSRPVCTRGMTADEISCILCIHLPFWLSLDSPRLSGGRGGSRTRKNLRALRLSCKFLNFCHTSYLALHRLFKKSVLLPDLPVIDQIHWSRFRIPPMSILLPLWLSALGKRTVERIRNRFCSPDGAQVMAGRLLEWPGVFCFDG